MFESLADYISVIISISALAFTIIIFAKKQKSDQFRTALDVSERLEKATNELIKAASIAREKFPTSEWAQEFFLTTIKAPTLELLTVYEIFALLVNHKELTNQNIIKHFKHSLKLEVDDAFKNYPDIAQNEEEFTEVKELLKKWNEEDSKSNGEHSKSSTE